MFHVKLPWMKLNMNIQLILHNVCYTMGIPRFFTWVQKRYPYTIQSFHIREKLPIHRVDNLYIDMNGVIHPCAQQVFGYGNSRSRMLPSDVFPQTVDKIYEEVCDFVFNLIHTTRPMKFVGICVDGVAGYSKSQQQRHRRFRSASERSDKPILFDPNCISPGTEFMDGLLAKLTKFIQEVIVVKWPHLKVLWSPSSVPGEGEHKIMQWIRAGRDSRKFRHDETHVIHGLDADMFMLSIATFVPNIYLLREDHWDQTTRYVVSINALKDALTADMQIILGTSNPTDITRIYGDPVETQHASIDFVLMGFMVGNDFVPRIPTIEIAENSLELLIDIYGLILPSAGRLTVLDNNKRINVSIRWNALYMFMKELAARESDLLHMRLNLQEFVNSRNLHHRKILKECVISEPSGKLSVNMDYYRSQVCKRVSHIETLEDKQKWCEDYMHMFDWILRYYVEDIPSWNVFFRYASAPFASDLIETLDDKWWSARECKPRIMYDKSSPPTPLEQLLSVLPPQSKTLLPTQVHSLMTSADSVIIDFYPVKFDIIREFSVADWEGHVMIPPVDPIRMKNVIKTLPLDRLPMNEHNRLCKSTTPIIFTNKRNYE